MVWTTGISTTTATGDDHAIPPTAAATANIARTAATSSPGAAITATVEATRPCFIALTTDIDSQRLPWRYIERSGGSTAFTTVVIN